MSTQRRDRQTWEHLVRAWKKSGLSCAAFARREGLPAKTFSWWAWKLGASRSGKSADSKGSAVKRRRESVPFLEVTSAVVTPGGTGSGVELDVGGVVVRVGLH